MFILVVYGREEELSLALAMDMNSHHDNQTNEKKCAKAIYGNENKIIFSRGKEKEEHLLAINTAMAFLYDNQQVKR